MLALLGFAHLKTMHQMNGLKNLCGVAMALVSTVYFTHAGLISWSAGLVMAGGTFVGGYAGARLSRKVSSHLVHDMTVVLGLGIVLYLLLKR